MESLDSHSRGARRERSGHRRATPSGLGQSIYGLPLRYHEIWQFYKAVVSFWTVEEVDLGKDMNDWEKKNGDQKYFISRVLAFIAASYGIVIENLCDRFKVSEACFFYGFQIVLSDVNPFIQKLHNFREFVGFQLDFTFPCLDVVSKSLNSTVRIPEKEDDVMKIVFNHRRIVLAGYAPRPGEALTEDSTNYSSHLSVRILSSFGRLLRSHVSWKTFL